ncbi:hypothetical protein HMPREF1577_01326 [Gardnerella pickettii JCP8017A]|uniref:Uncharacterized protein n=1 Tax=Gardnerella pickettii JCP8017A TaxID=1261062 RepID=T2PLA7_9BIFI|nr:hypothetical protein HMPREF1577_01326 [Gardnerella pickettii JCP8017A]
MLNDPIVRFMAILLLFKYFKCFKMPPSAKSNLKAFRFIFILCY